MPKLVITHNGVDVDSWLKFKSERADAIGGMGGTEVVDHVGQDGSKKVAVSAEVDDVGAFLAAIASPPPELLAAMERHGVIRPLTVCVERSRPKDIGSDPLASFQPSGLGSGLGPKHAERRWLTDGGLSVHPVRPSRGYARPPDPSRVACCSPGAGTRSSHGEQCRRTEQRTPTFDSSQAGVR